jgi:hypothetical protein
MIKASGSNVLIEPAVENNGTIWVGIIHSIGYGVPSGKYEVIDRSIKEHIIYDKKDCIEIVYNGKIFDSIPHYKIHAITRDQYENTIGDDI